MGRHFRSATLVAASLFGSACIISSASAADVSQERSRIASQRTAAKARLIEQERACQPEFFVSACVDAARTEHRAVLKSLHDEELALDEAKRVEDAKLRRQALADKATAKQERVEATESAASGRAPQRAASASPPAPHPRSGAASQPKARSAAEQAQREALEEQNKANFEARARSAQAHREAVELRNSKRSAPGKRGAPLPVPDAASAAPRPASAPAH